jgi:hypothetical protein
MRVTMGCCMALRRWAADSQRIGHQLALDWYETRGHPYNCGVPKAEQPGSLQEDV